MELFTAVEQFDLAMIRDLYPDSPVLEAGEGRLAAARQARTDRLAEQERQRQRQAEEAARQAELERQRIAQTIETHWAAFETALKEENFNEAEGILAQVRALNPEEPGLADREQQLTALKQQYAIKEHWTAFETAMGEEDFDEAGNQLDHVRGLDPDASGLVERAQRLEAAQERHQAVAMTVKEIAGQMVSIPSGTFLMGSSGFFADSDEKPAHNVTVSTFMLGKYEVTVGQFRRFVEATGYRTDADGNEGCYANIAVDGRHWRAGHSWRNPGFSVGDEQPVACVNWNDAQAFIEWLAEQTGKTYRLPTEAEWEYAARAGSTTKYHYGDSESQLCRYANHADTSTGFDWRNKSCSDGVGMRTAAVGRYQPNSYGLHDMHGNVREWVEDCWNESYRGAPTNGRAWTSGDCSRRVLRGGSWYDRPGSLRSAYRGWVSRSSRYDSRGFRLAQDK